MQDARETLQLANSYMGELGKGIHELTTIKLSDRKVQEFINEFFPVTEDLTDGQRKNNLRLQEDLKARYYNAPDLEWVGKNGWRFVNAVSDFATHADPIRKTRNYNENLLVVVVVLVIIFWTAHDFKKAGAEVVNEKNIRKYLDYLVNDNGWTKSGGLIPTYTSPCGKKGCYADWERRIYAEYNKKKLSSTEITAFFEQFQ